MSGSSTFRWLVSLVTAVSMPLCCCSLDSVLGTSVMRDGAHPTCHMSHHDDGGEGEASLPAHEHGEHSAPATSHSGDHQKDDGCRCGGDDKVGAIEGKSQYTFPPLVLAHALPDPAALQPLSGQLTDIYPDSRAPFRPAQTLLRQHCALVV